MEKELILIRGVSGAGKTTLGETVKNFTTEERLKRCSLFSADDYFTDEEGNYKFNVEDLSAAHEECQEKVRSSMSSFTSIEQAPDVMPEDLIGRSHLIMVHNTFTKKWEMQAYFDLAKEYNYRVTTIIVENRHESCSLHDVPEIAIARQKERFEVKL